MKWTNHQDLMKLRELAKGKHKKKKKPGAKKDSMPELPDDKKGKMPF